MAGVDIVQGRKEKFVIEETFYTCCAGLMYWNGVLISATTMANMGGEQVDLWVSGDRRRNQWERLGCTMNFDGRVIN